MGNDESWAGIRPKRYNDRITRSRETKRHENRVAGLVGGNRLSRSGARRVSRYSGETEGADIDSPSMRWEHKRTERKSISLKREWLETIERTARRAGKEPGLVITFCDGRSPKDWAVIPLKVLTRLLERSSDEAE